MRKDDAGLFWENIDDKLEAKKELLISEGYSQVIPGFWAYVEDIAFAEDVREICKPFDVIYREVKKEVSERKAEPPYPVWLEPDYLPGLEEARRFNVPLMTDIEVIEYGNEYYIQGRRHPVVFDIECYVNYFLIGFMSLINGRCFYLEMWDNETLNIEKAKWIFEHFQLYSFNGNGYDIPIASLALNNKTKEELKYASTAIIELGERSYDVLRAYKTKKLQCDHVDIKEVAPQSASLKTYGGRLFSKKLQDLPFPPETYLSKDQRDIIRYYCINDLATTDDLVKSLRSELKLRLEMSEQYGIDLRSKSDAQIAEAVLRKEVESMNGHRIKQIYYEPGTKFYYQHPEYMQFQTKYMQDIYDRILQTPFEVSMSGKVLLPEWIKKQVITINKGRYNLCIGGLHSKEKCQAVVINPATEVLKDVDVASYYPFIIINQQLYPEHMGPNFLSVYGGIVYTRIDAKKAGIKKTANSLKIVINGSFGKLGSQHSVLYSPHLLIQVTISGQLSLLMLIEALELVGIPVVSANTDGIVIRCPKEREPELDHIVKCWEKATGFDTEETRYAALFSRDVNNYLAVKAPETWKPDAKLNDKIKTKGIFAKPGLSKNPRVPICVQAVKSRLIDGIPVEQTIKECQFISEFCNLRNVKGGGVKIYENGECEYLGKIARWYYSTETQSPILYANSGNKVSESDGARPMMEMLTSLPVDLDYDWYIDEANRMLKDVGFM